MGRSSLVVIRGLRGAHDQPPAELLGGLLVALVLRERQAHLQGRPVVDRVEAPKEGRAERHEGPPRRRHVDGHDHRDALVLGPPDVVTGLEVEHGVAEGEAQRRQLGEVGAPRVDGEVGEELLHHAIRRRDDGGAGVEGGEAAVAPASIQASAVDHDVLQPEVPHAQLRPREALPEDFRAADALLVGRAEGHLGVLAIVVHGNPHRESVHLQHACTREIAHEVEVFPERDPGHPEAQDAIVGEEAEGRVGHAGGLDQAALGAQVLLRSQANMLARQVAGDCTRTHGQSDDLPRLVGTDGGLQVIDSSDLAGRAAQLRVVRVVRHAGQRCAAFRRHDDVPAAGVERHRELLRGKAHIDAAE
mmetsp:Transcript_56822/g.164608  ORF Transcript_56822/g.164608 Transcript_56822/m.164608 type:complete len:360 (-) Transcript_56822:442-1521(-)